MAKNNATLKRQEKFYPTEYQKSMLKGLARVTGKSKSSLVIEAIELMFKQQPPEIIEAAKFRRAQLPPLN